MPSRSALARAFALAALVLTPALSRADSITFSGSGGVATTPVSYTGTMDVTVAGGGTSATVNISLTNTTSGVAGPYASITGFGLSLPTGIHASTASGTSNDASFHFLQASTPGVQIALQAGNFTYAFSTDATQLHTVPTSAEVNAGIMKGQTETFTITLTSASGGLTGLTAANLIEAQSAKLNGITVPFDVRFRSTNTHFYQGIYPPNGDKITVSSFTNVPPPHGVPAPPGVLLGLIGAGCMLGRKFRRKVAPKVA